MAQKEIVIVLDTWPGPEDGCFVEMEDETGKSIKIGEWRLHEDNTVGLHIPVPDYAALEKRCEELEQGVASIDGILARRPALAEFDNRVSKIEYAIKIAGQRDALEMERDKLQAQIVEMVNLAADNHLAGYREMGQKCAALERERDESRKWASAQSMLIKKLDADNALLKKRCEEAEISIQQLRGALGYAVPGSIIENPEIVNGLSEAKAIQITELERELEKEKYLHQLDHSLADQWQAKNESLEADNAMLRKALEERDALADRALNPSHYGGSK